MSFVTGVVGKALTKKKKANPLSSEDRTITVKQPVSPWQTIYGSARVGGTVFFLERDGNDVWMGVVWAAHECKAIDSIYTDDTQNFVNADGAVTGVNASKLFVYNHLGDPDQTYDTTVAGVFPLKWTSDHRLRGRCHSFLQFVDLAANWDNTVPNVSADIRGRLITDTRTGNEVFTDNAVQCINDFIQNEDFGLGEPSASIDTANINAESNICDQEVDIPNWSEHFVIKLDDTFTVLNLTGNTLQSTGFDTDWNTGDSAYLYNVGGGLPGGTSAATLYYVRTNVGSNANVFCLYTSLADAQADTNRVDVTTNGTGTHHIISSDGMFRMLGRETTFTASAANNEITPAAWLYSLSSGIGSNSIGLNVVFDTTGTMPSPLLAGTKYALYDTIVAGPRVYDSTLSGVIDITTAGTGTHSLRALGRVHNRNNATDVSLSDSTITISSGAFDPLYSGLPVIAHNSNSGGTLPEPLIDGTTYFVIVISDTSIKLAASRSQAERGEYIRLGAVGTGTFALEVQEINQDEMLGATTGTVVQVARASGSGSLPTGLSTSTDYYFIRRGRGYFQLATSLQNALDGTAISITDAGSDTNLTYKITLKRERRFTCNLATDADQDKRDVLKGMANGINMGAILEPLGTGKWRVKTGTYRPPVGSLNLSHIRAGGVPEIMTRLERRSAANTIKGVYNSPLNFDQASDFPAVSDPRYVDEDDGEVLVEDITLPTINSKTMARRIATSWLKRKRQQRSIRWPATLSAGFKYEYGDTICVTIPLLGYANKVYRLEEWEMSTGGDGDGTPIPRVDLLLREAGPSAF